MSSEDSNINLYADPDKRAGVFSDYMTVKNVNGKCVLDFFMIDDMSDGGASANLASRIIMTPQGLLALKDMLNRHVESTGLEERGNE